MPFLSETEVLYITSRIKWFFQSYIMMKNLGITLDKSYLTVFSRCKVFKPGMWK